MYRRRPTLPLVEVPLALLGLTALFGMGRGGNQRDSHLFVFVLLAVSSLYWLSY